MEENILDSEMPLSTAPKRSQLLKVLCILSFIMCGLNIVFGILAVYQSSPEVMQKNIEQVRAINPEAADRMEDKMIAMENNSYAKISPYLGMVYALISFLGVMMMWNLKRAGFYVYSVAEILPYSGFIFMGKDSMNMGPPGVNSAVIGMVVVITMVIIDLVFVGLYARTLKEMK